MMKSDFADTTKASGPVFIAGTSGTGKTQLRLALQTDPQVAIFRKTYLWRTHRGLFGDLAERELLVQAVAAIASDEGTMLDPFSVGRLHPEHPYESLFATHYELRAAELGKSRWGVQMGGIEEYVDPILEAIPEARFVHLMANPRDLLGRGPAHRWLRRSDTSLLRRWLKSAQVALAHRDHPAYKIVMTSDLVGDPGSVVAEVANFLGLEIPDSAAAVADIDFGQVIGERRRFRAERLSDEVRLVMQSLGVEQDPEIGDRATMSMTRDGGLA